MQTNYWVERYSTYHSDHKLIVEVGLN